MDVKLYEQVNGSLLYLSLLSRADIFTAVPILDCSRMSPAPYCRQAVQRMRCCLRGTTSTGILFELKPLDIPTFLDSDYASEIVDPKSMTGFIIKVWNNQCVWGSKMQHPIALPTRGAKYHAMSIATTEIM